MGQVLLRYEHPGRLRWVVLAGGDDEGVQRSAQPLVGAIEFEAGRTVRGKAEITDNVVLDTGEHPRHALVLAHAGFQPIIGAVECALGSEPYPDQLLRGAAVAPPQPAIFAVELVIVFARLGSPGSDASLGAAYLDDPGQRLCQGDLPVEAVAAEIAEASAAVAVSLECIEHCPSMVLGVGSR